MDTSASWCSEERSQVAACGIPELKCACGWPAAPRTSSTIRNPARRWLQCGGELCRDELNQSKRELAEMKDKIESEKDMLQWVMHMLMLMCVLCVPVVVGKNYLR
uniref:Uncharacterized protein n=1 Tax=Oryza meridionalis TaxID=40149 RepID=A0A0E0EB90_9ORYZ